MIEIVVTAEFERGYSDLPVPIQRKAERRQKLFVENPFHPSLETEKLNPKSQNMWSFRIDRKYRIIFRFLDGGTVLFLGAGPHGWIYKSL